jgi:hypothetical protein
LGGGESQCLFAVAKLQYNKKLWLGSMKAFWTGTRQTDS